jgi:hypothetical protein
VPAQIEALARISEVEDLIGGAEKREKKEKKDREEKKDKEEKEAKKSG